MKSIFKNWMMLGLVCSAQITLSNPEHAAKHGIEGVWTYPDKSMLPEGCLMLETGSLEASTEKLKVPEVDDRFIQHTLVAQALDANYTVINQDYSVVAYYKCQ